MNKKALSSVVATVLIILLVVAAVALIWRPIRGMIGDTSEKTQAKCLLAEVEIVSACKSDGNISISIKNGPQEDIAKFQVIYGTTTSLNNTAEITGLDKNQEKTFIVDVEDTVSGTMNAVKIAPYVESELCDATEVKAITTC